MEKYSGRKNTQDSKRAKVFQKLAKEIFVATNGGTDVDTNASLWLVVYRAKAVNMPNDNIKRAIDKAAGNKSGGHYDEITYESYGPDGIAVLVHVLTDNRNRIWANVRVAFNKNGGNFGETGSVAYMFDCKGYIVIEREGLEVDEDTFMLEAIEAGTDGVIVSDEV